MKTSIFYLGEGRPFTLEGADYYPITGKISADPSVAGKLSFLKLARDFLHFTLVMSRFARHHKPERLALYAHTPVGGLAGAFAKTLTGLSLVYDPHDWHYDSWAQYHRSLSAVKRSCAIIGYKILAFVLPRTSDLVVCVSVSMMQSVHGSNRKLLIPNIVEDTSPLKAAVQEQNGLVVFVGHVAGYQGVFNLIRAFRLVQDKLDSSRLLVIGDGEDLHAARALAQDVSLRNVVFTGAISHEKAYSYVEKASVCVAPFLPLPFVKTSCPIKLLEYVAMNKRIVVTDVSEFRQMLKGYRNATFASATPEKLAQSLISSLQTQTVDRSKADSSLTVEQLDIFQKGIRELNNLLLREAR